MDDRFRGERNAPRAPVGVRRADCKACDGDAGRAPGARGGPGRMSLREIPHVLSQDARRPGHPPLRRMFSRSCRAGGQRRWRATPRQRTRCAGRPGPPHRCPCPAARCAPRGGTAAPPASRLPPLGDARSASRSSGHASGRAGRYPRVRRPARARSWAAADEGSAPQHYFVSVLETAVRAHRISHGSHSPTGLDGLKHPPTRIRLDTGGDSDR